VVTKVQAFLELSLPGVEAFLEMLHHLSLLLGQVNQQEEDFLARLVAEEVYLQQMVLQK
jgi:hypothetical protein